MTNKTKVTDDAFEKWYADKYGIEGLKKALNHPYKKDGEYVYESTLDKLLVWQSASQHYEREMAELKVELETAQGDNVLHRYRSAQLSQEITRLEGIVEQNKAFAENDKAFLDKITQLSAQVNQLRGALETAKYELEMQGCNEPYADENSLLSYNMVKQALATNAPQSLQAFENEVLERAAEAIDEMVVVYTNNCDRYKALGDEESTERNVNKGRAAISCAEVIRALKG